MEFEWDPSKSAANVTKHGVSFEEALVLWAGQTLEVETIAKTRAGETRGATLGVIADTIYAAIWTTRGTKLRLISVRRARNAEKKAYIKKIHSVSDSENF